MKIRRTRTYKLFRQTKTQFLNITTSLVLVTTSMGTFLPTLLSQKAFAAGIIPITDSSQFQTAIDNANPGDTIDIQPGNYTLTSTVTVNKPLTITAEHGVHLNADGLSSAFSVPNTGSGSTFQNLTFVANTGVTNNGFIAINANNITVKGSTFNAHYAPGVTQTTRGLVVSPGVTGLTITGNYFNTIRQPAYLDNGDTGTISNNYAEGTKGWVVGANSSLSFTGNTWGTSTVVGSGNLKNAVDIAIIKNASTVDGYSDILGLSHANHNAVVDNQYEGLLSESYVDATGTFADASTATGNGYWTSPFRTIQAGIDATITGGVVHIAAGTYTENPSVAKSITLLGANAGVSGTAARGAESTVNGTVTLKADHVTVDGLAVEPISGDAISADFDNPHTGEVIKNNVVWANGYGIHLNDSDTTVSNNTIVYKTPNGIGVETSNQSINNFTVSGNVFSGDASSSPADITIIGNASPMDQNIAITNNTSTSGTTFAALFNTQGATIVGNTSTGATGASIVYLGGNVHTVSIANNTLTGGGAGVNVTNDYGNGANGGINAYHNDFTGDTKGVQVKAGALSDATLTALNNWWGDASGPTDTNSTDGSIPATNPYGAGSLAVGAVNYDNWCTTASCGSVVTNPLPAPTNLTPANNTYTKDTEFVNTWSAVPGAAGYEYQTSNTLNGGSLGPIVYSDSTTSQPTRYTVSGGTVTRKNLGTPDGVYYWQVRAIGTDGSKGAWSVIYKVTEDTIHPDNITITPASGSLVHGIVTWKVTDTDTNPSYIYVELNKNGTWLTDNTHNGTEGATTSTLTSNTANLNGTYTIKVDAVDKAGNTTEKTYTYTIDNTRPVVTFTQTPSSFVNGNFDVAATITDANGIDPSSVLLQAEDLGTNARAAKCVTDTYGISYNADNTKATVHCTIDTSALQEGYTHYVVWAWAKDVAGNSSSNIVGQSEIPFVIDRTAPVLTITSPAVNDSVSNTLTVSGKLTDNNSVAGQVVTLHLRAVKSNGKLDGFLNTFTATVEADGTWSTTLDVSGFAPGQYGITALANDAAGNSQTASGGASVKPFTIATATDNSGGQQTGTNNDKNSNTPTSTPDTSPRAAITQPAVTALTLTPNAPLADANAAVLGDSTTDNSGSTGKVKGDKTVHIATSANKKAGDFLGLGWWWLLIVAVVALGFWLFAAYRRSEKE